MVTPVAHASSCSLIVAHIKEMCLRQVVILFSSSNWDKKLQESGWC